MIIGKNEAILTNILDWLAYLQMWKIAFPLIIIINRLTNFPLHNHCSVSFATHLISKGRHVLLAAIVIPHCDWEIHIVDCVITIG